MKVILGTGLFGNASSFCLAILSLLIITACGGGGDNDDERDLNPLVQQDESVAPQGDVGATADSGSVAFNESSYLLTSNEAAVYKVSPITGQSEVVWSSDDDFSFTAPADVIGNVAYLTANDNSFNAIDVETGFFLWDVPIGEYQDADFADNPSAVVCDDATCWARGSTGLLQAVSAQNGSLLWSTPLHPGGDINEELNGSELLVTEDKIYVMAHKAATAFFPEFVDPLLFVVDRTTGTVLEKFDMPYSSTHVPRLVGNTLVLSMWGEVLALNATTYEVIWRINQPDETYTGAQIIGNVLTTNILRGRDQFVVGIELSSGRRLWSVDAGFSDGVSTSTTDGRYIYAMGGDRDTSAFFTPPGADAMAIDPATGSIVWKNDGLSLVSNPLPVLGSLFYGYYWDISDTADGLTRLDASTGRHEWVNSRIDTPGLDWFTRTPMLVHNGEVYRSSRHPDAR